MRSALEHSSGAYISSVLASEDLKGGLLQHGQVNIDLKSSLATLRLKVGEERLSLEELDGMSQKGISLKIDLQLQATLVSSLSAPRDKAKLASLSLPHAGD